MKPFYKLLPALAAACMLLAGCGQAGGAPPASSPSTGGPPAGAVPASSYHTLYAEGASQNTVLYGEGRLLYNGPGFASFVTDAATGEIAGYAAPHYSDGRVAYTLYDLSGQPLLECGDGFPDQLLNGWVHLQYNMVVEVGGDSESVYQNLATGETRLKGYLMPAKVAEGVFAATRSGRYPTTVLLNSELEIIKDLDPWRAYYSASDELPADYFPLVCEVSEGDEYLYESALLRVSTGEILENFVGLCGPGLACFEQAGEYLVTELSTGRELARGPLPFEWYDEKGWMVRAADHSAYTVKLGGQEYACRRAVRQDGLFVLELEGAKLLLDQDGRLLADTAALGAYDIWLLPGGYYTVVYNDDLTDMALYSPEGAELARDSRYCSISQQQDAQTGEPLPGVFSAIARQGNIILYDLLDGEGTPFLTGLNSVYSADENTIAVRKGFTRGIMDYQGNWLWSESIFDSFEDEEEELW